MSAKSSRPRRPGTSAYTRADTADVVPSFHDLTPDECLAILARNDVGRIAFGFEGRIDLQPIHYVNDEGRIFGRTSEGEKLATLRHSPWVAFEVDERQGTFDWRSVVVHGTFYVLPEDGSPETRRTRTRALELLRHVVPGTGTPRDPVAFRDVVFEIAIDTMRGREATSKPG
jgi:nitroimidazol reductase NimA-like FMN-containing flavoprotein (pyridoxamine 5'-phosphate oxidase superfamily)